MRCFADVMLLAMRGSDDGLSERDGYAMSTVPMVCLQQESGRVCRQLDLDLK
jgi:hypothetical protein